MSSCQCAWHRGRASVHMFGQFRAAGQGIPAEQVQMQYGSLSLSGVEREMMAILLAMSIKAA